MAGEIIEEFGDHLDSITLIRGEGGRFEVEVDGKMVFSKEQTQRHPNPGEVVDAIRTMFPTYVDQPHSWVPK